MTDDVNIDADVVVDPFVALHLHRHTIVVESKSAAKPIMEIHRLSKLDLEIHAPLADAGDMPLLAAHLLNHHHHHLFIAEGQKNTIVALLNLSIFTHKRSCASQHVTQTFYNLLSIEAYYSIIISKKPLIGNLMDLLGSYDVPNRSIKDALKTLFGLAIYPLNHIGLIELGTISSSSH
ncbi:hypothetical protein GW17_00030825 [Ensete ventricosum]|nr:hypothetical protein GW17_00030825 [Ensete ventricosum]